MKIIVTQNLPIDETRKASCIETKEEVTILTGKKINAVKFNDILYVSPRLNEIIIENGIR